jgi:hypothetical protein
VESRREELVVVQVRKVVVVSMAVAGVKTASTGEIRGRYGGDMRQMRQAIPSPSLPRPPAAAGCWLSRGSLTRAPETPEGYMTLDEGYMTHPRGGDEGYMTLEVSARGACKNSQRTPPQRGP